MHHFLIERCAYGRRKRFARPAAIPLENRNTTRLADELFAQDIDILGRQARADCGYHTLQYLGQAFSRFPQTSDFTFSFRERAHTSIPSRMIRKISSADCSPRTQSNFPFLAKYSSTGRVSS